MAKKQPAKNRRKFEWAEGDVKWLVPPRQDHGSAVTVRSSKRPDNKPSSN